LNSQNRKQFLIQAKAEGFRWIMTKEIQQNAKCAFYVVLDLELKIISNLSCLRLIQSEELQDLPVYEYNSNSSYDLTKSM
jgi:hypothetical protein